MTTAYDVLGINSNADDAAIKAAFRRAAKKCHPDLNEGDRNGERLRLLIAARAAALSSLRQLERKSRDLAAKAAGRNAAAYWLAPLRAAAGILFIHVMSHPPEPAGVIGPSMGTLNVSTQAPASWEQGLEDPSARPAGKPVQPPEMPPSFDVADADETGKIVAAGSGKAGWTIRLIERHTSPRRDHG